MLQLTKGKIFSPSILPLVIQGSHILYGIKQEYWKHDKSHHFWLSRENYSSQENQLPAPL